jgi:hypothetical protein
MAKTLQASAEVVKCRHEMSREDVSSIGLHVMFKSPIICLTTRGTTPANPKVFVWL